MKTHSILSFAWNFNKIAENILKNIKPNKIIKNIKYIKKILICLNLVNMHNRSHLTDIFAI